MRERESERRTRASYHSKDRKKRKKNSSRTVVGSSFLNFTHKLESTARYILTVHPIIAWSSNNTDRVFDISIDNKLMAGKNSNG